MMKKWTYRLLAGALTLGLAASLTACGQKTENNTQDGEKDLEKITFVLDWTPNTNHTGIYVAIANGYFEDAGLEVEVVQPPEDGAEVLVASGKAQFGVSFQDYIAAGLIGDDPLPITAVAAIIQHNTSGFATYEGKGIKSPKDFEGKTYAGWGGPGEEAVLNAVMTKDGADFSKLNMVISDGSGFEALKDKADIMWFYEAWDNVKCQMNDFPIDYMPVRELDERLDYYTPVIIASDDTLKNKPELVKKFLAATEKGYQYAIENPETGAAILQRYAPDYPLEMLEISQNYLADKYMEDADRWGVMKDEVWDRYTEFMMEYGVINKLIPASDCYTNEFLPE